MAHAPDRGAAAGYGLSITVDRAHRLRSAPVLLRETQEATSGSHDTSPFLGLVLGWINADFCNQDFIL